MKNAIIFTAGSARYAVELRWVRDVIALGHVTPMPRGPAAIAGVVNVRGAIVPVLDLPALLAIPATGPSKRPARPGDVAVLLEVEGARAAVAVDAVQTVMTLAEPPPGVAHVDHHGRPLELLDPPALLRTAVGDAQATAARVTALLNGEPA